MITKQCHFCNLAEASDAAPCSTWPDTGSRIRPDPGDSSAAMPKQNKSTPGIARGAGKAPNGQGSGRADVAKERPAGGVFLRRDDDELRQGAKDLGTAPGGLLPLSEARSGARNAAVSTFHEQPRIVRIIAAFQQRLDRHLAVDEISEELNLSYTGAFDRDADHRQRRGCGSRGAQAVDFQLAGNVEVIPRLRRSRDLEVDAERAGAARQQAAARKGQQRRASEL